jgi:hypothetical protein
MMHRRCSKPDSSNFKYYGGRGINVCQRWSGPDGFANFLADMGPRPLGPRWQVTIERINNDLGYFPSNCKWSTDRKEQIKNKRSHGWNRLTPKQVRIIRTDPRRPYRLIAADYGVTRRMIGMIIRGDAWRDLV